MRTLSLGWSYTIIIIAVQSPLLTRLRFKRCHRNYLTTYHLIVIKGKHIYLHYEELEDTKGVIKIHKSKNR